MTERLRDDLRPWVDAFSQRLEDALDDEAPPADLAAALERARQLSDAVPDAGAIEAEGAEQSASAIVGALGPFVIAYRERLDERVRHAAIPPRAAGPKRASMRATLWIAGGVLAAALLLVWVAGDLRGSDRAEADAGPRAQAADVVRESSQGGSAKTRVEPVPKRKRAVEPKREAPAVEPRQPEPEPPVAPRREPQPKRSLDERIADLDAQARRKWQAGDRAGAERDFRRIVAIGGRRRAVQVAYADLFALVRQRGDDPSTLWRDYLERFPKGRFAEDAKAGLCRLATAQARADCWAEYRERFPNGMHQGRP